MDKLKGQFSTGQVQPLNFGSGHFSSSNVGQYIDFNITNLDLDVIQDIYVVMNAKNMSTTVATIPLPATHLSRPESMGKQCSQRCYFIRNSP